MAKPKPPVLDIEQLRRFNAEPSELKALRARLQQFETSRKAKEVPPTYIALDALSAFVRGRLDGHSDTELRETWPSEWGEQTITVPLALLAKLAQGWKIYTDPSNGATLGEAMKLEGGGQGSSPVKRLMQSKDRRRKLANAVISEYVAHGAAGQPISLEVAKNIVADSLGCGDALVNDAYRELGKGILQALEEAGVIGNIVGETSRSLPTE
jgi:hypothetical protein